MKDTDSLWWKNKSLWEIAALLTLLISLLIMGPANVFDESLDHGSPYGWFAQDTGVFTGYMYSIEKIGNWKYHNPNFVRGIKDVVNPQPWLFEYLGFLLSQSSGIPYYATGYIIVSLLILLSTMCFYFIIRMYSRKIALLGLPLMVLLFSPIFITAFTWGNWPYFTGSAMLVAALWCLTRIKEKGMVVLSIIALGSVLFGHGSEYIFLVGVVGFWVFMDIVIRQFEFKQFLRLAFSVAGSLVLTFYYAIIFFVAFLGSQMVGKSFTALSPDAQGLSMFVKVTTPGMLITVLMGIGVFLGLFFLHKHRVMQTGFVFFVIGFTNYIGTEKRGLETRYFWPIYLSVFFGLLIYLAIKYTLRSKKVETYIYAIISIALTIGLAIHYYTPVSGVGYLSPEVFSGLRWVDSSTPENATLLYFYGDSYLQAGTFFISERISEAVTLQDYAAMAQSGQLRRSVETMRHADRTSAMPHRTGLFSFGYYTEENAYNPQAASDICSFDYVVFDKVVNTIPQAGQYNQFLARTFLANFTFTQAYENPVVLILKNNQPGGDCLGKLST